jgi:hypothetical protein
MGRLEDEARCEAKSVHIREAKQAITRMALDVRMVFFLLEEITSA